jgi:release factor glutamine methyltransferase
MSARSDGWTILKVLDWTRAHFEQRGIPSARLDAELILAHALSVPRVMLYARFDQPLLAEELDRIRPLVARRARHEPMAYLLGRREFWSLDFEVSRDVLVPRPDTETLVELALGAVDRGAPLRVVDVGTGSGCVAVALATELPAARVHALELSPAAAAVARRNVERHGLAARVEVVESDLLDGLPAAARPVDLLVANLPYIPTAELAGLMPDVRDFEPRLALDGGADGLALVRRLIASAPPALAEGAFLVLEAGAPEVPGVAALLTAAGFEAVAVHRDPADLDRCATGRWPGPRPLR